MEKITSRKMQAQRTKKKIYKAAVDLFEKHGFDNTTIEDISRKAGVSVGAFYHYYPSKTDVYYELYKEIDDFYEITVEPLLKGDDFYDNIIIFFKYYGAYNGARGTDAVTQLFNSLNVLFLDKSRYMYRLLLTVIKKGEEKKQLTAEKTVSEIEEFLFVVARGIVYDWLLHAGAYDLEEKMVEYITEMRHIFVM